MECLRDSSVIQSVVVSAYENTCDGWSTDRVLVDSNLNSSFLLECNRIFGNTIEPVLANRTLLNLRKAGKLSAVCSRRTTVRKRSEIEFAAEIAARHVERSSGESLDEIFCNPSLRDEFDNIALQLSDIEISWHVRWVALSLRKRRRLRPEVMSHAIQSIDALLIDGTVESAKQLPRGPGLYAILDAEGQSTLYVGETQDLRQRLVRHMEHSDRPSLAQWLWKNGHERVKIAVYVLDQMSSKKIRRALENELIKSRQPLLNILV